jgi:hypothetical protein
MSRLGQLLSFFGKGITYHNVCVLYFVVSHRRVIPAIFHNIHAGRDLRQLNDPATIGWKGSLNTKIKHSVSQALHTVTSNKIQRKEGTLRSYEQYS